MNKVLKIMIISLITVVLMVGCFKKETPAPNDGDNNNNPGNENKIMTLTCELSNIDEGENEEELVEYSKEIITYKNDTILKLETVNTSEGDTEYITALTNFFNKIDSYFKGLEHTSTTLTRETGTKVTIASTIDFEKLDVDEYLSRSQKLSEEMPDASNNITKYIVDNKLSFSKYKSEVLKDYTCK